MYLVKCQITSATGVMIILDTYIVIWNLGDSNVPAVQCPVSDMMQNLALHQSLRLEVFRKTGFHLVMGDHQNVSLQVGFRLVIWR